MTELIKLAKAGDTDAFIRLIDLHKQTLYKTARSILYEAMDIDDAISDTILTCWEHLGELKKAEYFRTWLIRILINKCKDIIRSNKRTVSIEVTNETQLCNNAFSFTDQHTEFEDLISCLDEECRVIFVLYYSEKFKIREIAQLLGISEGTIGSKLQRGREQLRKSLLKGGKEF